MRLRLDQRRQPPRLQFARRNRRVRCPRRTQRRGLCQGASEAALGSEGILGVSCYADLERAAAAAAAGADYLAFGAMYPSPTKPDAPLAPAELIAMAKAEFHLPVAVIGGITLDRVPELIAAGADMVAVISDLFDAMDIASRARSYQELFSL